MNASGRSPMGWTPDRFAGRRAMPFRGWEAVTVPGAVGAWVALSERFGRLPFEALFAPAVRYAESGYAVTPAIAVASAASTALPPCASIESPACAASGCEAATTFSASTGERREG
jgi:gamma-glutamyltranspeptidase/glutathione hydrolase